MCAVDELFWWKVCFSPLFAIYLFHSDLLNYLKRLVVESWIPMTTFNCFDLTDYTPADYTNQGPLYFGDPFITPLQSLFCTQEAEFPFNNSLNLAHGIHKSVHNCHGRRISETFYFQINKYSGYRIDRIHEVHILSLLFKFWFQSRGISSSLTANQFDQFLF